MAITTVKNTMLYCPKCQKTYEEGTQRFCLNEGERLLPATSGKSANQSNGVFTNVLKRKTDEKSDKFSSVPKFSQTGSKKFSQPDFPPLAYSTIFKAEKEFGFELELELEAPPKIESESPFIKPSAPPVKPVEVTGEAVSGEDDSESADEPVLTTESLLGQTVENRYRVTEKISEDESGIAFLAEDNKTDKKVVVKFPANADDSFADKIFAEERISLSQINHPNIANIVDAGELSGGKMFVVTEYVEGETIVDYLKKHGQLNALRTARIVRQASEALGAAHQSGVLHRNLTPENLILTVDENGAERIKLTNFGAAQEKLNEENLLYKSPEQVEGKIANPASDNYSLAVIAYRMLTNRLPFNALSVGDLLKLQREGLRLRPSDVRSDLPPLVDEILKKALSFNSFDRYARIRDFGDEFFSEIIAYAPLEEQVFETIPETTREKTPAVSAKESLSPKTLPIVADAQVYTPVIRGKVVTDGVKATEDLAWEKRSAEMPNEASPRRYLLSFLGIAALLAALLGAWYYFINRPNEVFAPPANEIVNQNAPTIENPPPPEIAANVAATPQEIEAPPLSRTIKEPPDSIYFQNNKENLKGDAVKNFLGFSLYYPKDWTRNEAANNFLDVSRKAADGLPQEQLLISYYTSKGSFKADEGTFPAQVNETNATLKKILPNYRMISEGKKTVNNGWQAYEVIFEGTSKNADGKDIKIWGKRLFIPTAIRGMKNGYVITMLATSLSKDVKRVEDVGVKGELSTVLETFEPNQNF